MIVALAGSAAGVFAGDWTGFRGPLGNGLSDEVGLPVKLSAEKHVIWKTALPGKGLSSPLVVGDRVRVTMSPFDLSKGTVEEQLKNLEYEG